jgi:hypothetical protein
MTVLKNKEKFKKKNKCNWNLNFRLKNNKIFKNLNIFNRNI